MIMDDYFNMSKSNTLTQRIHQLRNFNKNHKIFLEFVNESIINCLECLISNPVKMKQIFKHFVIKCYEQHIEIPAFVIKVIQIIEPYNITEYNLIIIQNKLIIEMNREQCWR